ncbi:MAG: hypothetical protein RH917_14520 [Lacipirellulaceae bacterium]
MQKSLDAKLRKLQADSSCNEFILADAKDADMAFGLAATGSCATSQRPRTLDEYRDQIRAVVKQGLIDISLMSASTAEVLSAEEGLFADSTVTPAIRMNDSTDIWLAAGTGNYAEQPSLPHRSASIEHVLGLSDQGSTPLATLGLYSITMNNNASADRATLEAFAQFRREAVSLGLRYFLEVFPPNAPGPRAPADEGAFVRDTVIRVLAGLTRAERPQFLKIPYLGPELTEQLASYDSSVILGIMGGASGTTHDAFALLASAKQHGVRAALFGRRINNAEDQCAFVQHLRGIADGELKPQEAVRSYHAELERCAITPHRSLNEDLELTPSSFS